MANQFRHSFNGGGGFGGQQRRVVRRRPRVSNKNVILAIALGILYFLFMPVAILIFVGMYYFKKVIVRFRWRQMLMPALGIRAIASVIGYPCCYMTLRVTTFVLFILYICRRFSFSFR